MPRPRRGAQSKRDNAEDDDETSPSSSDTETQRGRPSGGKLSAAAYGVTSAPATRRSQRQAAGGAGSSAAPDKPSLGVAGTRAKAEVVEISDSPTSSDADSEDESAGEAAKSKSAARRRTQTGRAVAGTASKVPTARTRNAAGAAAGAGPSNAAAADARTQQLDASRHHNRATDAPATGATAKVWAGQADVAESDIDGSASEDAEDEEEEVEEEVEEEAEGDKPGPTSNRAPSGRGRGRGAKSGLVAPTTQESRKRLFDLLERRIGSTTGDGCGGGGRRVQYSDLPVKNPNKKSKLMVDLRSHFDDWHSRLRSNFSILLYGFGSKRGLLEEFARLLAGPRNRGDAAVLVFHGYQPRCTAREVVTGVAAALMQRSFRIPGGAGGGGGVAPAALRALVEEIRHEPLDRRAFVVIHNLDGQGLREDVPLLAALAACPQVHVIASTDHALAPLLWDSADAARFRWQYINASTFQPYLIETSGAQSLLMGAFKSGVVTAGAGTVLRSLVLGAQEVFKVLAEYLLEDEECEGVAFAHLMRMCRERYLVRDERVLRQHLVEFVDHQLVRVRPGCDIAGELLTVPMSRGDIRAVLDDIAAARGE